MCAVPGTAALPYATPQAQLNLVCVDAAACVPAPAQLRSIKQSHNVHVKWCNFVQTLNPASCLATRPVLYACTSVCCLLPWLYIACTATASRSQKTLCSGVANMLCT